MDLKAMPYVREVISIVSFNYLDRGIVDAHTSVIVSRSLVITTCTSSLSKEHNIKTQQSKR